MKIAILKRLSLLLLLVISLISNIFGQINCTQTSTLLKWDMEYHNGSYQYPITWASAVSTISNSGKFTGAGTAEWGGNPNYGYTSLIRETQWKDNSTNAIKFSFTVKKGTIGTINCIKFDKRSYEIVYSATPPADPCGVRILKNGVEVFKGYDYPLTGNWTTRNIALSGPAFNLDGMADVEYTVELLGYGSQAMVNSGTWYWMVDNMEICGCWCDNVTNGGTVWGNQTSCSPYTSSTINSSTPASGGSGSNIQYQWYKSNTSNVYNTATASQWTAISGATGETYSPGTLYSTTYYVRLAKRGSCNTFTIPSNVIAIILSSSCSAGIVSNPTKCTTNSTMLKWDMEYHNGSYQYPLTWTSAVSSISNNGIFKGGGTIDWGGNPNYGYTSLIRETQWKDSSTNAIRFSFTVKKGTIGTINCIKFDKRSYEIQYSATAPVDPCGVRILKNGVEVFKGYDYPLTGNWTTRNIPLGGTDFILTGEKDEVFSVEILGYGSQAMVNSGTWYWMMDNLEICGCWCDNVTNGGTVWGNQTSCSPYTSSTINSSTDASGGSGSNIEYQWYKSTTSNTYTTATASQWTLISGATNATYAPGVVTTTTNYVRLAKRGSCNVFTIPSNVITITITGTCATTCSNPSTLIDWDMEYHNGSYQYPVTWANAVSTIGNSGKFTGTGTVEWGGNPNYGYTSLIRETQWKDNSSNAIKFNFTVGKGTTGSINCIKFDKRSYEIQYSATAPVDPCGVRILKNGVEVFKGYDYPLTGNWTTRNIALSGPAFNLDGSADVVFSVELLGYGSQTMVNSGTWYWMVDNIEICGCITNIGQRSSYSTYFDALKQADGVRLEFGYDKDIPTDQFILERSTDNITFDNLDFVNKSSSLDIFTLFNYIDNSPNEGLNYYRVKWLDTIINEIRYSNVKTIDMPSKSLLYIYPNPTIGQVTLDLTNLQFNDCKILISNEIGQDIKVINVNSNDILKIDVDLTDFYSGIYFVRVEVEDQVKITKKIIKLSE